MWKGEICNKRFAFVCRIRLYFNKLDRKTITSKTNKTKKTRKYNSFIFPFFFQGAIRQKQIPWKRKWTKQHWILLRKRRLTTIIKAEMKLPLRKNTFAMKKCYFQSIISFHALKLALNKRMRASDDEQGINKLWPNLIKNIFKWLLTEFFDTVLFL